MNTTKYSELVKLFSNFRKRQIGLFFLKYGGNSTESLFCLSDTGLCGCHYRWDGHGAYLGSIF